MNLDAIQNIVEQCFNGLHNSADMEPGPNGEYSAGEFDKAISTFESFQQATNNRVNMELIRLKRCRNHTSLIHRLPSELLTQILLLSVDLFDWSLDEIKSVALVSTLWFDIVNTTSGFWPELCVRYPPNIINSVVKRNPTGPLRVRCETSSTTYYKLEPFMAVAARYAYRWEALFVNAAITSRLRGYLSTNAPLLRDIMIHASDRVMLDTGEGLPFRHLHLHQANIDWNTGRLSGLKTIHIRRLDRLLPSTSQFHAILSASPQLERLLLADLQDNSLVLPMNINSMPVLRLHSLFTIDIRQIPYYLFRFLLSTIDAPNCRGFSVRYQPGDASCEITDALFRQTLALTDQSPGQAYTLYSETGPSLRLTSWWEAGKEWGHGPDKWVHNIDEPIGVDVDIGFPRERCLVEQAAAVIARVAISFAPTLVAIERNALEVIGRTWLEDEEVYRWLVVPWRSVVYLNIHNVEYLRYLARPYTDEDGNEEWLCPRLVELRIWYRGSNGSGGSAREVSEQVVDFANCRYGSTGDDAANALAGRVPLERLVVYAKVTALIQDAPALQNVEIGSLEELSVADHDWPSMPVV